MQKYISKTGNIASICKLKKAAWYILYILLYTMCYKGKCGFMLVKTFVKTLADVFTKVSNALKGQIIIQIFFDQVYMGMDKV